MCLEGVDLIVGASPSLHSDFSRRIRFVCISDTHNSPSRAPIPSGDVLLHTGDFTNRGTREEYRAFEEFLKSQPHPSKIVILGNHDQPLVCSSWMFTFGVLPVRGGIFAVERTMHDGFANIF